jgi:cobalt-zinc-cadmium efflux system protein
MAGHHHPHVHVGPEAASTRLRLRVALGLTALFVVLEGGAGYWSHSLALLSDSGHNLADAFALGLTLWTFELVTRPATARRTYGMHRATILGALANAIGLVLIAVGIFVEAVIRLRSPEPVVAGVMAAVAAVALVLNLAIALWLHAAAEHDLNIRASFVHLAGDAASAAGVVMAGVIIAATGQTWLDPAISILIGLFILWTSREIIVEAVNVLLESTPTDLDARTVQAAMCAIPGVLDVHDLHLWSVSSTVRAASAHVLVSDQPVSQACAILGAVNGILAERYQIAHSSLQLETTACDPSEVFCQLSNHQHRDEAAVGAERRGEVPSA